ncbi:Cation efflux system protein CusB precursor [Maioricimonas rarisocia]|uniref:Cation efflux system protein CusB n=1 Tax=Maioricimonas rarisocia TaxID=2528026 RepID=A0A517ZAC7_9PLAN|nr:efflux RND transporter periplasmic adaptor subunit [Maioricimonas rarisocia]QDU39369.1 Cation efflux system protein CusB precursor [Maioricimonas rarisocia]
MQRRICLCFAAIVLSLTGAVSGVLAQSPVIVSRVVEREVRTGQTFVGTILPEKRATIGSAVGGRVVEFPIDEGDRVEEGQALAKLLTNTINLELDAAEAELQLRKHELEELENGTRPEEITQARAQMEAARTALTFSEKRLERIQRLAARGDAATQDQLDEAIAGRDNAQATLDERTAAFELAGAGPRKEQIAQARARVAMQSALVQNLESKIVKHTMIARFNGYVVSEHTEVGAWVNSGDPVAEIVALDRVDVLAHVLETHVPHIRPGIESRVEVPALPDRFFVGKVAIVIPEGDQRSRTFPVKVRLENEIIDDHPLLKAGMLARVTLPTGARKKSLLVPKDALVLGGPSPMVYVIDVEGSGPKGKARPVPVELDIPSGSYVAVAGKLKPGERVVVRGNERLRPDQEVTITGEIAAEESASGGAGE